MTNALRELASKYEALLRSYLVGDLSVSEFQKRYLEEFKTEVELGESLFEILDEYFGDVDSFTLSRRLLQTDPGFYVDEAGLRLRARNTLARLLAMRESGGETGNDPKSK